MTPARNKKVPPYSFLPGGEVRPALCFNTRQVEVRYPNFKQLPHDLVA